MAEQSHVDDVAQHETASSGGEGLWIFGYGSLLWRPSFAHAFRSPSSSSSSSLFPTSWSILLALVFSLYVGLECLVASWAGSGASGKARQITVACLVRQGEW